MKLSELIKHFTYMMETNGDVPIAYSMLDKEFFEFLGNKTLTDDEWAWLAKDISDNWSFDQREVDEWLNVLDEQFNE